MDKITIIVPVYNAENTIERCLASFISNRDYIQEVILVNDRSTDRTFEKIDQFRTFFDIRVINNEGNKGPGPGRKTGLLAAATEWITFVDADDCLTASSLAYVAKQIDKHPNIVLLHTQTTYYESGVFVKENVAHSDYSCGGNFYKRSYLIENKLFPHDNLFMAEDEYFNAIITMFIHYYATNDLIQWYDYPVYEVHHDFDTELSFAFSHWVDYLCKYRLLSIIYRIDFFKTDLSLHDTLKKELYEALIFEFFIFESFMQQQEYQSYETKIFLDLYDIIQYCINNFKITAKEIIDYFYNNPDIRQALYDSACLSSGIHIDRTAYSFPKFIKILYNYTG